MSEFRQTHPEYQKLVLELKPEEYQDLVESISEFDQRNPIVINEEGEILDGHHRFNVCNDLGIEPKYEIRKFDDKLLEKIFVIDSNLARRQLETYSRGKLILKLKRIFRELQKTNG